MKEDLKKYLVVILSIASTIPGVFICLLFAYYVGMGYGVWLIILPFVIISMFVGILYIYKYFKKKFPDNEWSQAVILTSVIIPLLISVAAVYAFIQNH